MNRRDILQLALIAPLASCASREPKPPLKPNEFKRLGYLPIKEWPASGGTASLSRKHAAEPTTAGVVVPINPTMLGLAIGQAIRSSRDAEQRMVLAIGFEPEEVLSQAIKQEFAARQLQMTEVADAAIANAVRRNRFDALPKTLDVLLDVQISVAGYYNTKKPIGHTPYFKIDSRLLDLVNPGESIASYFYGGDYGDANGNSRYFTAPTELCVQDLGDFSRKAVALYAGLTTMFQKVGTKIVDDFYRTVKKLPVVE